MRELLSVGEDGEIGLVHSTGEDMESEGREPRSSRTKNRRAAVQSVLSMLDRQDAVHGKTKSVDIDDLALELDPLS